MPYKMAQYLDKVKNVQHKRVLTKIKTGCNCLNLVKGQGANINRSATFQFRGEATEDFLPHCESMVGTHTFLFASLKEIDAEFQKNPMITLMNIIFDVVRNEKCKIFMCNITELFERNPMSHLLPFYGDFPKRN